MNIKYNVYSTCIWILFTCIIIHVITIPGMENNFINDDLSGFINIIS